MPFSFFVSDFVSSHVFSPFDADENLKHSMSAVVCIGLDFESRKFARSRGNDDFLFFSITMMITYLFFESPFANFSFRSRAQLI